jgi:hypothetical protein
MSIGTNIFVHNTATIKIKKSLAGDKQSRDTWDIIMTKVKELLSIVGVRMLYLPLT